MYNWKKKKFVKIGCRNGIDWRNSNFFFDTTSQLTHLFYRGNLRKFSIHSSVTLHRKEDWWNGKRFMCRKMSDEFMARKLPFIPRLCRIQIPSQWIDQTHSPTLFKMQNVFYWFAHAQFLSIVWHQFNSNFSMKTTQQTSVGPNRLYVLEVGERA